MPQVGSSLGASGPSCHIVDGRGVSERLETGGSSMFHTALLRKGWATFVRPSVEVSPNRTPSAGWASSGWLPQARRKEDRAMRWVVFMSRLLAHRLTAYGLVTTLQIRSGPSPCELSENVVFRLWLQED